MDDFDYDNYEDDQDAIIDDIIDDVDAFEQDGEVDQLVEGEKQKKEGLVIDNIKNVYTNIVNTPKKTIPIMTKFESTRIIGVRTQQLALGAKALIPTDGYNSVREIAIKELMERKTPFIVRRTLPNNLYEDWKIEEFQEIKI